MTIYYKPDLTQISLKDILKNSPNIRVCIACLIGKMFPSPIHAGVPRSEKVIYLDEDVLNKERNLDFNNHLSAITELGFSLKFFFDMYPPLLGKSNSFVGVFLNTDSLILAFLQYFLIRIDNISRREIYYSFYTKLSNGHFLVTTSNNKTFKLIPPEFHVHFKPLKSLKKALEYHRHRLNDTPTSYPVLIDERNVEKMLIRY
ncbi:MAG: hypothetical protein ACYTE5_00950 [Planctomycetota bacterium]|jgi:hypothetical protein